MVNKHQVDLGENAKGSSGAPKGPTISLAPVPGEKKKKSKSNSCC